MNNEIANNFQNPSPKIRGLMVSEIKSDKFFYEPKTIPSEKFEDYKNTLIDHFKTKSLSELGETLNHNFIDWDGTQADGKKISGISHLTLAEGEWNKYFQRATCKIAMGENCQIKVVRWMEVDSPKMKLGLQEGDLWDPEEFLSQITRFHPFGPNSGLTIETTR